MATNKKSTLKNSWISSTNLLPIAYLLRVLVTLAPSNGYVHPDEFFQSTEPMAVHLSRWKGSLTWEWTEDQPLRCALFPYLLGQAVFRPLQALYLDQAPPAYLLLVLPRLLFTLLSFASDLALYRLHTSGRLPHLQSTLLLHASSHVVFAYLTRTFANSIEYLLYAWLLVVLVNLCRSKSTAQSPAQIALLALICTLGVWARATFAAFALYPIFFWCTQQCLPQRKAWNNFRLTIARAFQLTTFALPIALFLIIFDTYFYKPEVIQQIVRHPFS
jgi:phosphatidylinositol glycan class Z